MSFTTRVSCLWMFAWGQLDIRARSLFLLSGLLAQLCDWLGGRRICLYCRYIMLLVSLVLSLAIFGELWEKGLGSDMWGSTFSAKELEIVSVGRWEGAGVGWWNGSSCENVRARGQWSCLGMSSQGIGWVVYTFLKLILFLQSSNSKLWHKA